MTIGQRIRKARLDKGYTQEELAKKMGYKGKSIICKYEKNADNVTIDTISAFAKALDVTESYLMGWDEVEWTPETQELEIKTDGRKSILDIPLMHQKEIANVKYFENQSEENRNRLQILNHILEEMYRNKELEDEIIEYAQYVIERKKRKEEHYDNNKM